MDVLLLIFSIMFVALRLGYLLGYNKAAKEHDTTWMTAALRKTEIKQKTRSR